MFALSLSWIAVGKSLVSFANLKGECQSASSRQCLHSNGPVFLDQGAILPWGEQRITFIIWVRELFCLISDNGRVNFGNHGTTDITVASCLAK